MDYKKIHDSIINRALSRTLDKNEYYENHHIIPICEGGFPDGPTVPLTLKEHRLVHLLRYKINGNGGNRSTSNLLKNSIQKRKLNAKLAAKKSHDLNHVDVLKYYEKQKAAGKSGGRSSFEHKAGFHSMTENEKILLREKGRNTTVKNKLGMFSDEYRNIHKEKMKKKIKIDNMIFNSCTDASKYYKVSPGTISYWISKGKAEVVYEGIYSYKGVKK